MSSDSVNSFHEQVVYDDSSASSASSTSSSALPITPKRDRDAQFDFKTSMDEKTTSPFSFATGPVSALTAYLRKLFGINGTTTKRTLSEEAESGSPDSIAEWLRTGSDPNEKDAYGYTPLVNACMRGCNRSVKTLLANGANVNLKASHGYTPLHTAAQYGFVEIAELLIDAGADLELKNDDGDTPLILAVRSENAPVVDLLCQRGCNIHAHGFDDIDPLEYALNKRNLYLSDVLMKHERQHLYHNSISPASTSTPEVTVSSKTSANYIIQNPDGQSTDPESSVNNELFLK